MGFQQGLSGLDSANTYLDVVGNNIANANTVGYKGSVAEFADVYANTLANSGIQVGIGERTSAVAQDFSQGTTTTTNNPLDIAIQGNGFFRLIQADGSFTYSRNGQFQLDRNGYIVNQGANLAGYIANSNGVIASGGTPQAIQVQTANIGALATGASNQANAGLTLGMNFNATAPIINQGTKNVSISGLALDISGGTNPGIYTTRIVDSTGQLHNLQVQVTNVSPNTWQVQTQLDNSGNWQTTPTPLVFNATGQPQSGTTQAITYTLAAQSPAYGTTPLTFDLNFSGVTENTTPAQGTVGTDDTAISNATIDVFNGNLNSASPNGTTQTYSASLIDPNGVTHAVQVTLSKSTTNAWAASYTIDPAGAAITGSSTTPLIFNSNGLLTSGTPVAASFQYGTDPVSGNPLNMTFNINLSGITQQASATTVGSTETRSEPQVTPSDPTTYTSSTSATVYDAQGVSHTLTFYFTKVGVNTWEVQTSMDGATPMLQPSYVTFGANGQLVGGGQLAYAGMIASPSGAQNPLAFNTYFTGTTQLGSPFSVNKLSQDGYADGSLTGLTINANGTIQGNYSNGQNRTIGQITLFNFTNPQGLQSLGGNQWAATFASNQAIQGTPGTGDLGTLQSGAVENANIDLTKELVNMITAQRSYQANAETIKTQDQILQTITSLR
jgi:flagellar hook protein FlgE